MPVPLAHIGGMPVEETVGSFGPALFIALGAAVATVRARLRPVPSREHRRERREKVGAGPETAGP